MTITKLVQVLQSIDNHIEYEIELANNVGLKQDILDKYDPVKYIIELDTQILKKIKNSEKTFYGFYKKAFFLDLSGFKHVNEKIYSELLYRMFEMSANNKNVDVNRFIREFYAYCNKNSFAYAGEETIDRLKKYLQLAEPYIIKTKYEDNAQEDFRSNSGQQENTDFFAETKEDAYGVKLIIDLLFQYNIEDEQSLNKMLKKAGGFHFFCMDYSFYCSSYFFRFLFSDSVCNYFYRCNNCDNQFDLIYLQVCKNRIS